MQRWKPGDAIPLPLASHIREGGWIIAHGASFERTIWNELVCSEYAPDAPPIRVEQQSCTMARAQAMALPADLDRLADVLGVEHKKDAEGYALMRKMAKPRRVNPDGTIVWWDEPEKVERLAVYCDGDVYSESDIDGVVPWLTPSEQAVWELDQRINDRGIKIDVGMVARAIDLIAYAKQRADEEMHRLTNGAVAKCTNVADIVRWLNSRGVACEHLRKGDQDDLITLAEIYNDDTAKAVIELRRVASKTSVAKYAKYLDCVCADGRVRGLLAYHGAATGRWAGRLVQPQNFPRVDGETEGDYVEFVIQLLTGSLDLTDIYELIETVGAPKNPIGERQDGPATLAWLSKSLRSTIICEPGNKLVGGDFSNIEGRVTAWLSDEEWKLEAFRAYDLGYGPDIYKLAYSNSFGVSVESVTKPLRQLGKVQELALGFQGGVGAYLSMTHTYLVKLHMIVKAVRLAVPPQEWAEQEKLYPNARDRVVFSKQAGRVPLAEAEWTALKIIVKRWRKAHPNIVANWWALQDAAIQAVDEPGNMIPIYGGKARYMSDKNYLYCQLPSGRVISYASPSISQTTEEQIFDGERWLDASELDINEILFLEECGYDVVRKRTRYHVRFMGLDDEKRWRPHVLYGGYQCENIVQGTARDVMVPAMLRAEAAGYPLILTNHDELLAEPPIDHGSAEEFEQLMSVPEPWMLGLPVAAAAWEGKRYTK